MNDDWQTYEDETLVQDTNQCNVRGPRERLGGAIVILESTKGETKPLSFLAYGTGYWVGEKYLPIVRTSTTNAAARNSHAAFPPSFGGRPGILSIVSSWRGSIACSFESDIVDESWGVIAVMPISVLLLTVFSVILGAQSSKWAVDFEKVTNCVWKVRKCTERIQTDIELTTGSFYTLHPPEYSMRVFNLCIRGASRSKTPGYSELVDVCDLNVSPIVATRTGSDVL